MTSLSPFQRLLGADFERLPAPVHDLHSLSGTTKTAGLAEITTARNPGAWFLCWIAGLPRPGRDVSVTVAFHPDGKGRETWERHFASRRYASTMVVATGRNAGLLTELFGPFRLFTRLTAREDGLAWSLVVGAIFTVVAMALGAGSFIPWPGITPFFRYEGAGLVAAAVTVAHAILGNGLIVYAWLRST